MKVHSYIFSQILLWLVIGVAGGFCFFQSGTSLTWFDLLIVVGFSVGIILYFYQLLVGVLYGKAIDRKSLSFLLPNSKTVTFSLAGQRSAKFIVFSKENLIDLKGTISLTDGQGRLLDRLLLNQPRSATNTIRTPKSTRINRGGKSASMDHLRILSWPNVEKGGSIAELRLDLDWYEHNRKSTQTPIVFEIIARTRTMLPHPQSNLAMLS